jgi:hypothetical protein
METYCARAKVWWFVLASHVHRYHRSKCRCLKVCMPLIVLGKVERI